MSQLAQRWIVDERACRDGSIMLLGAHQRAVEIGVAEVGAAQGDARQVGANQQRVGQVGALQIGSGQICAPQIGCP